jgi:hypothetical protein
MLTRRAEPGSDQQAAELVTIQGGGMGFIVQPRTADMGGRGVIQQLFFDGVVVEPGDGGQPAGHGGAGASSGFQFAGEPFDVGAAGGEQGKGAGAAPAGELAQVQGVGLAVRPRYPARASRSESVKAGWIGTRAAVIIGHLPDGLRPGRLGQRRVPAIERKPTVSFFQPITTCHRPPEPGARSTSRRALQTADYEQFVIITQVALGTRR